jgi:hypothetical protein
MSRHRDGCCERPLSVLLLTYISLISAISEGLKLAGSGTMLAFHKADLHTI